MEKSTSYILFLLVLLPSVLFSLASAADADPIQDFCVATHPYGSLTTNGYLCKPNASVTSDDFFSSSLTAELTTDNSYGVNASFADVRFFPGLNTLGISMARVVLDPGGVVPAHTHPRASEMVFVTEGRLLMGFVTTDGRYFSKVLGAGEVFVFLSGLMHFQYNVGTKKAVEIVAYNSQLPGLLLAAPALFGSTPTIPDVVLAKSFLVDRKTVDKIKSKFG
ncbi:hypothetical protein HPP92_012524 [Vanilla planifolia]|uniref:Germin-like protein n=1 Tax=Vanilla planifolia TaxID=51239 RepID=A0A835R2R9_VANPL|nr:hypothetical protein HPP92_012524 [Vanilla planifolia]